MELNPHSPPTDVKCDLVQIRKLRHPGQICLLNPSILPIKQSLFPQDLPAVSLSKDSLPGPAVSFLPHSVNFFARNDFRSKPVHKRDATAVKDETLSAQESGKVRVKVSTAAWALPSHALQLGLWCHYGRTLGNPSYCSVTHATREERAGPRKGQAAAGATTASP